MVLVHMPHKLIPHVYNKMVNINNIALCRDVEPVERSAEDIRKEMERLEIIRKKREDDRKKRIEREGWDRFAPVSETNRPPGRSAPES